MFPGVAEGYQGQTKRARAIVVKIRDGNKREGGKKYAKIEGEVVERGLERGRRNATVRAVRGDLEGLRRVLLAWDK